jgi:cytochrome c5
VGARQPLSWLRAGRAVPARTGATCRPASLAAGPGVGRYCDSAARCPGTVPGMPSVLRLGAVLIVVSLSIAACGGGGNDNGGGSSSGTSQSSGGSQNASAEGKTVFNANCKGCHTLQDAGATGSVGPNLDDVKPDEATVKRQVENGGGPMPAFKGKLSDAQINAVSAYVSSVAGQS